jgi:hypothetical protein
VSVTPPTPPVGPGSSFGDNFANMADNFGKFFQDVLSGKPSAAGSDFVDFSDAGGASAVTAPQAPGEVADAAGQAVDAAGQAITGVFQTAASNAESGIQTILLYGVGALVIYTVVKKARSK